MHLHRFTVWAAPRVIRGTTCPGTSVACLVCLVGKPQAKTSVTADVIILTGHKTVLGECLLGTHTRTHTHTYTQTHPLLI